MLSSEHCKIFKNICERMLLIVVIYCIKNWIKLFRNQIGLLFHFETQKSLYFTYPHSYSFILSLAVIPYHSLSFFVTRLPLVVTRCTTRCHTLSLVVPLVSLFINDPLNGLTSWRNLALNSLNSCKTSFSNWWNCSVISSFSFSIFWKFSFGSDIHSQFLNVLTITDSFPIKEFNVSVNIFRIQRTISLGYTLLQPTTFFCFSSACINEIMRSVNSSLVIRWNLWIADTYWS